MEPIRPEDKRAAELESLRNRNLAKTMQEQLDGKGQPIDKESWYQQQKEQSEQIKKHQNDAESNLRSFRNENIVRGDEVKEELKKKEMEAAAMLRNYRGTSDAVLSHQVKKISTAGMKDDSFFNTHGFSPLSSPHAPITQTGKTQANNDTHVVSNPGDEQVPDLNNEVASMDDFFESLDNEFLSPNDSNAKIATEIEQGSSMNNEVIQTIPNDGLSFDESDTVELKTQEIESHNETNNLSGESSNNDSDEASEWVVLAEEEKTTRTTSEDFAKVDYSTNNVHEQKDVQEPPESPPQPLTPQWLDEEVSISFGLLTGEKDAPLPGTDGDSQLLHEVVLKMKSTVSSSLQDFIDRNDVKFGDQEFGVRVIKDGSYVAPQDRPNTVRSAIRMNIPLAVRNSSTFSSVEKAIRNALKNSLLSIYP